MAVKFLLPSVTFLYLDRDLVGITEIAKRTGRTRQNVSQWVTAERHSGIAHQFPKAEGVVGRARVWLWAEVDAWLRQLGLGDNIPGPTRGEMTDIDYMIRHHQLLTLERPATGVLWPLSYVPRDPIGSTITCNVYNNSTASLIGLHYMTDRTFEKFPSSESDQEPDEASTSFFVDVSQ